MAEEAEDEMPESGAVFTFGKSKFADNIPSKFWLKNDVPQMIACGDEHTALITENRKLFMFGSNNWGQLGLGSKQTVQKPTCVKALKSEKVQLVACGRNHTLISTERGHVYACGGNGEGQLGLGDCEERTTFQRIKFFESQGPVRMLAAGSNTSAALTASGKLFMWGENTEGQIGLGKRSQASSPQEVSVGRPVSWVSCGYYHSALVTADGALYTFGERDSGKLGLGTEQLSGHRVPQRVKSITDPVKQVACGGGHTVALTDDDVYSFGLGQFGQLGHGTFIFESRLPRPLEHFRKGRVCRVSCGENHTAVVTEGGLLYTFGDGRHGKLGLGEENFTNQFKPTLCPRFLKYSVQAAACGGCHMVVLARPRDPCSSDVTLEDDDVTEDILEKPYVELLGDTADSSALQRSLSARVRRRERERSPDQFGTTGRTLPAVTPGFLQPPLPVSGRTAPPRLPPPEPGHTKVLNGTQQQGATDSIHQEQTGGGADSAVEGLTDTDSVRGLGETTDFLNMTHVMKMDPSDKTLTLSPLQKRKGKHAQPVREQSQRKERKLSSRRALPTQLLRGGGARHPSTQRQKKTGQNKENLLLTVEERRRTDKNKAQSVDEVRRAGSRTQLTGKSQKPAPDWKQHPEPGRIGSESGFTGRESKAPGVKGRPAAGSLTDSQSFSLSTDSSQPITEEKQASRSKQNPDLSKKSKNKRNRKEAEAQRKSSDLSLLAGAATLAAGGAVLVQQSRVSNPSRSESSRGVPKPGSDREESESRSAQEFSRKPAVSINLIPASESPQQGQEEEEEEEEEGTGSAPAGEEEEEGWRTSPDVSQEEEVSEEKRGEEEKDSEALQSGDLSQTEEEEEEKTSGATESENETEEKGSKGGDIEEEEEEGSSQETQSKGAATDEEEESSLKSESEEEEDESDTLKSSEETEGSEEEEEERKKSAESEDEETEEEEETEENHEEESEEEEGESKEEEEEAEEEEESEENEVEEEEESEFKEEEEEENEDKEEDEDEEENEDKEEDEDEEENEDKEEDEDKDENEEEEEEEEDEEEEESEEQEEDEDEEENEDKEEDEDKDENEEEEEEKEDEEEEESEEQEEEDEEVKESEEEEQKSDETEDEDGEEEEKESDNKDEEEEAEEEEEEVLKKKASVKKQQSSKAAAGGRRRRGGGRGPSAGEEEEFWDDVLPEYLSLK
ncbi:retinitis pigmentosa GTPase regulator b [Anableps anableps]